MSRDSFQRLEKRVAAHGFPGLCKGYKLPGLEFKFPTCKGYRISLNFPCVLRQGYPTISHMRRDVTYPLTQEPMLAAAMVFSHRSHQGWWPDPSRNFRGAQQKFRGLPLLVGVCGVFFNLLGEDDVPGKKKSKAPMCLVTDIWFSVFMICSDIVFDDNLSEQQI